MDLKVDLGKMHKSVLFHPVNKFKYFNLPINSRDQSQYTARHRISRKLFYIAN